MSSLYSYGGYNSDGDYTDWLNQSYDEYDYEDDDDDYDQSLPYDSCSNIVIIPNKNQDVTFIESEKLKDFLHLGVFTDVSVRIEDKEYKLHRVVLSLRSEYFQKLFAKNFIEYNQTEVELKIVEIPIFDCIVKYMYENDLRSSITSQNMTKLLVALDYLQIEVDLTWFSQFIWKDTSIPMTHLFELFDFLTFHSRYPWLLSELLRYFSNNLKKISQCEYFCMIPFEYLKKILLHEEINDIEDEGSGSITKICAKWICYDIANRSSNIIELVNAVKYRYSKMFFLMDTNLNLGFAECDNNETYIERKLEELLNYSVEFIPGSCSDCLNLHFENALFAPKNVVNFKPQMKELLHSGDFSDITVRLGIKTFPLHRIVLASKSSYFYDLFTQNNSEDLKEIEINEIDESSFVSMLNYIYYQELDITPEKNIVSLIMASERLKMSEIFCHFETYIINKLADVSNVFELFSYLLRSSHSKLLKHVQKYIQYKWSEIIDMPNFVNITLDMMKDILSLPNVFLEEEKDLTKICIKWITHDYENRIQYIPALLPSICRRVVNITIDMNFEHVEDCSREVIVEKNLNRLLTAFNPVNVIKSEENCSEFEKPFFIASDNNEVNFLTCNNLKCPYELTELKQLLPGSYTDRSACATVVKDNLFVNFGGNYFYAQNLNTKRCVSLTSEQLEGSWSIQLLNCNDCVFLCNSNNKVLKFSPCLNRWLTVPTNDIHATYGSSRSSIFASNGHTLYAISTTRQEQAFKVQFYDERTKMWQHLTDFKDTNQSYYSQPISACFTNQNLFVAFNSFATTFNFKNKKWTKTIYSLSDRPFSYVKSYKSHIFFVDKFKIHRYNIYKKNWEKEFNHKDDNFRYLNVVHTI